MKNRSWFTVTLGIALLAHAAIAAAQSNASYASTEEQGMVRVRSSQFDVVQARAGANFRGYSRIMLDPPQVAMAEHWLRDMNTPPLALLRRTTPEDVTQIVEQARAGFNDTLAGALKRAGYELVSAPGPDVLRLSPSLVNLRVNAPASLTNAPLTRVYTFNAGEATLNLDIRDSTTGDLLGRVVDHRTAGQRGSTRASAQLTTAVTNRFDFGNMFDAWSSAWLQTLDELKLQSPGKTAESTPLH